MGHRSQDTVLTPESPLLDTDELDLMRIIGRREYLAGATLGFVSLSGCMSALGGNESDDTVRPDGDPPAKPATLACDDDSFERLEQRFREDDLSLGALSDPPVELRVSATEFTLGDEVTVTLANVGESSVETGPPVRHAIQLLTEEGWLDVRGTLDGRGVRAIQPLLELLPGGGFTWTFKLTDDGLTGDQDGLTVCPPLQPGRYRFVYWGLDDAAIGVVFDVE